MDCLYIVMPAFNELDNIEQVIVQWDSVLEEKGIGSKLVVADTGSTDGTHEKLLELQKSHPRLHIISDGMKEHGPKLMKLYQYAIQNGADYIFQTDSDGQTNHDEFEGFWRVREEHSVVLGVRKSRGDGAVRYCIEKVVCLLLLIYFGVKVPDANAPFRLMRSDVVKKYIALIPDNYNLPNILLTMLFVRFHENVLFKEISFQARQKGKNSVNIRKIIKIGWHALADFREMKHKLQQ